MRILLDLPYSDLVRLLCHLGICCALNLLCPNLMNPKNPRSAAQVHGHDFSCVAALPPSAGAAQASGALGDWRASGASEGASPQFTYVSGSEEKVLRVLEAPQAFHDTLALSRGAAPRASSQVCAKYRPDCFMTWNVRVPRQAPSWLLAQLKIICLPCRLLVPALLSSNLPCARRQACTCCSRVAARTKCQGLRFALLTHEPIFRRVCQDGANHVMGVARMRLAPWCPRRTSQQGHAPIEGLCLRTGQGCRAWRG